MQCTSRILIMKNLQTVIREKLKVNSKTKISGYSGQLSKEKEDQIIDELCRYFQDKREYKGKEYNTGLEVLEKYFGNLISDFLDYYQGDYKKLAELVDVDVNIVARFICAYNDEIYKEIKDFVLK